MLELSKERIAQILHEETVKKEDADTILRSVYSRYRQLYEKYLEDIDALNDDKIAEMRSYHEETRSLIKYYYMDIPQDVCAGIRKFETDYSDKLLGPDWHKYVFDNYAEFRAKNKNKYKNEEEIKAEFTKQTLAAFYDLMDYGLRDGFGTGSATVKTVVSGISGLLFGKLK